VEHLKKYTSRRYMRDGAPKEQGVQKSRARRGALQGIKQSSIELSINVDDTNEKSLGFSLSNMTIAWYSRTRSTVVAGKQRLQSPQ
jgi:hypothetical protein